MACGEMSNTDSSPCGIETHDCSKEHDIEIDFWLISIDYKFKKKEKIL